MKVESGMQITISYELRVDGGEIIETSAGGAPLTYEHGAGKMLPALERRIEGLAIGDEADGVIPAEEAYSEAPTTELPREHFPKDAQLEVDAPFQATGPDGSPVEFVIKEVRDDAVVVQLKHPLAGKAIRYAVKILNVAHKPPPLPPGS